MNAYQNLLTAAAGGSVAAVNMKDRYNIEIHMWTNYRYLLKRCEGIGHGKNWSLSLCFLRNLISQLI